MSICRVGGILGSASFEWRHFFCASVSRDEERDAEESEDEVSSDDDDALLLLSDDDELSSLSPDELSDSDEEDVSLSDSDALVVGALEEGDNAAHTNTEISPDMNITEVKHVFQLVLVPLLRVRALNFPMLLDSLLSATPVPARTLADTKSTHIPLLFC